MKTGIALQKGLAILIFGILLLSMTDGIAKGTLDQPMRTELSHTIAQGYEEHANIWTVGNQELLDLATAEGWQGTGAIEDPIIISGYKFYATLIQPVRIWNTDLHWVFKNNLITTDGVICGVWLDHTSAGIMMNNTFDRCHSGLVIMNAGNLLVENNTFIGNTGNGIDNEGPFSDSIIRYNEFYDLGADAITCDNAQSIEIYENFIDTMQYDGIAINGGNDVHIYDNTILNTRTGMRIGSNAEGIVFEDNVIRNIDTFGIKCSGDSNIISNNIIRNTGEQGILFTQVLDIYADNCTVIGNSIINCTGYSIEIKDGCTEITITENDFFATNASCHICDHGADSVVMGNFYDDWIAPDADENGIVDVPYELLGSAGSTDASPEATPVNDIPDDYDYVPMTPTQTEFGLDALTLGGISLVAGIGIVICVIIVALVKKR
ncbi:MAG: right-handed parallel beta-helix repeat-containing protein [Candidatus Thorarchaeota archaeon]